MARGNGDGVLIETPLARTQAQEQPDPVEISAATVEDIPTLARLKASVSRRTYEPLQGKKKTKEWVRKNCGKDHFEYQIGRSGYQVLVARKDGKIIAVASMHQRGNRMDLNDLYVLTPGEGIGTKLLERRELLARAAGCTRARVSVFRSNVDAKRFVQNHGFIGVGSGFREPVFGVMVDHYERDLR